MAWESIFNTCDKYKIKCTTMLWLCAGVHSKSNSIHYMTNELCDVSQMKQMVNNSVRYELYNA